MQITHHVGDETEEEEAANEEHAPDNSDVLEELNNSQAMHTEQDGGERVTVEFDPETLQQLASSQVGSPVAARQKRLTKTSDSFPFVFHNAPFVIVSG